ncbi:MAG: antitoxin [Deltaproteobacteria bacterium]|nr:antitoxin [Deltaproteobacteria bacterium]
MVKTQVQLPDHLYREGKRIAAEYEMSFADVVRRGLERVIPSFPPRHPTDEPWVMPELDLGLARDPFADPDWRANLHAETTIAATRRRAGRRSKAGRAR